MNDKYTELLTLAPDALARVPEDFSGIAYDALTGEVTEYDPGQPLPARRPQLYVYTIPLAPVDTLMYVPGAILCTKPDGTEFRPGMCLKVVFRYSSPMGVQRLLTALRRQKGAVPLCITLADLHALLVGRMTEICAAAAAEFSRGQTLPYTHWWNDLQYGTDYRSRIFTPMMQLFTSCGMRLEQDSFAIAGLAPQPV